MEDIFQFLAPVNLDGINQPADNTLGASIKKFVDGKPTPELKGIHLAIIGVEEERRAVNNEGSGQSANAVRPYLYNLFKGKYKPRIVDLGNIRQGHSVKDSYFALTSVCHQLIKNKIIPIVIGGGQDLTFPMYKIGRAHV